MAQVESRAVAQAALSDVLPALIETYGAAATAIAADWYDEVRAAQEVAGSFSAIPSEAGDRGAHELIGWAAAKATDDAAFTSLLLGGLQRRIANAGRDTIIGSSLADPRAEGWMRLGQGPSCAFCMMLIGRGAVYSEDSVKFGAHDDCNCQAGPKFAGKADLFDVNDYVKSQKRRTEDTTKRDNARAREWIAEHITPLE